MTRTKTWLVALTLGVSALQASAQSTDQLYRSWSWRALPGSPRTLGLAGAGAALSDDASAIVSNPATMVTLKKSELAGAALVLGSGTSQVSDQWGSWAGPGYLGGAAALGPRLAVGGYLRQLQGGVLDLSTKAIGGVSYVGWLDAQVIEGGAAVAYRVGAGLSVGVRLSGSHLQLEGMLRQQAAGAGPTLEVGAAAGETRITAAAGVLFERGRSLRLGLTVEPGCSWTVERVANDPARGGPLDTGSEYELRQPSRVVSSVAWAVAPKLLVVGQADYVRYSEIESSLVARPGAPEPAAFEAADAIEGRVGVEVSLPVLNRMSAQLRFGVASEAPGGLRYVGPDAGTAAAWQNGADRRELATAGAGLVMRSWRLDVAAMFGHDQPVLSAGVRVRF